MKNLITYLKALWSRVADSQSTDVSLDRRLTVGSPSFDCRSAMLKLVSVLVLMLTIGVGNAWGTYTITFTNNANSATAISSSVTAATTIASACRTYVNSSPYTVNSGNCYYGGDGKNNIRIGKSGASAGLSIALSASGQVSASTIVVNCMVMSGNKNTGATLSVNGAAAQTAPTSANNLTFTINDDITSITLSSTKAVFIYSITVNTGGGASVSTPTFSVAEGTYHSNQSVTISCATAGSTIYYTTNGTTPTSSSTAYSSAVSISSTTTLKAIAIKSGTSSSVASATYTLKCATPTFSPAAGTYGAVQSVSISTTYGTNIYYTTDGTTPTTSSTPYTSTISVSSTQTIKAIASKSGCSDSDEGSAAYTINIPYTVSFNTGTGNPTQADITEASAGAGITLPAGPTPACSGNGWSFAGWGYKSCDETSDEPYLYFPGNTYYPVDDEILYAVYVQGETSTTTYKLLSEGAQIAPDANYIITATAVEKAIKSEVYSSYYIEATDVTVTEDENGYYIANPNSELIWNMGKTGSTISLYNASDNNYLKIYETSGHHNLALDASKHTFTLSEVRDPGYASTFKMESTNDPGYYVLYSTSNTDFTATNNDDLEDTELYLYKQMHSGTYNSNPICCDNEVTLAHNSPTNGTVSFAPAGPIETCDGTVNTTMTITPAAGYTLTAFNYSTGAGTVSPTNQSPSAPSTTANSATPQVITLTFAQNANGTCTANATFSAIAPTAWSWTYNSAAIPNPINLYIGQTAALVATYTPAGNLLLNAEKNYDVVKSDGLTQVSKTYAVEHPTYTFRADAVMDDGTIVLTNHNHTSLTTTVHVHVAPLPLVHFVDIVHGYVFADVVGTIEDNVLVADKTTPTHDSYSGTGANDCETDHTRLVGWIEKTWADTHPDASHSDIIGAGTGVFIEANTAINVLTYNGNTYYAVWAKLE